VPLLPSSSAAISILDRASNAKRVAMQWGSDGKPTWYAPRWVAIWWTIPFMIAMRLIVWLASTYNPQGVHWAELGIVGFSVIAPASHTFVLNIAEKAEQD
jgi:hypothetical protein